MLVINPAIIDVVKWRPLRVAFWISVYVLICAEKLGNYINMSSPVFWSGLCCLLYLAINDNSGVRSTRFGIICALFSLLSLFVPVKTCVYLSCATAVFFLLESNYGKLNFSTFLVLIVMSPVFEYATTIFSFPLRLELTHIAGRLLALTSSSFEVHGNTIVSGANEFSVDPECMGLYMLETSFLIGIMMISMYKRKFGVEVKALKYLAVAAIILLLNLIANLIRLLLLVEFSVMPSNILHELIGLICLLVYIILPAGFLVKHIVRNGSKYIRKKQATTQTPHLIWCGFLAAALFVCNMQVNDRKANRLSIIAPTPRPGYVMRTLESGVTQMTARGRLIYVKPIPAFYSIEHNPMICWQGSGFVFQQVSTKVIGSKEVYYSTLENGRDKLYTAWWYESKDRRTISQGEWRWDAALHANQYSLINITCPTQAELSVTISDW